MAHSSYVLRKPLIWDPSDLYAFYIKAKLSIKIT